MSRILKARRDFLIDAMKSVGVLAAGETVARTFLETILSEAHAQAVGAPSSEKFYLHLTFPGAPPRWLFDLPLMPNGSSDAFQAGPFGTGLVRDGNQVGLEYRTVKYTNGGRDWYLPPVWEMGFGGRDFRELLPHMIMVRGIDMELNNHSVSNGRQVAPILGGRSISGAVADSSKLPLSSVLDYNAQAARVYKAASGIAGAGVNYAETDTTNPVRSLLQPFMPFQQSPLRAPSSRRLSEQVLSAFEAYAKRNRIGPSALGRAYDQAISLVDQNVISIGAEWGAVVGKYRAIITEALRPELGTLPGIYDVEIDTTQVADAVRRNYSVDQAGTGYLFVQQTDMRNIIGPTTFVPRLAENFALVELLLGRVTSNMTIAGDSLANAQVAANMVSMIAHDQHFVGSHVSTMATTLYFRAVLGCLHELVARFKQAGLFDRSVIHIGTEFNRNPRYGGSDHGVSGGSTSILSGMIRKFGVVGNILRVSGYPSSPNTWGDSAPFNLDGTSRPFQVNDVARTITSMLGISDVVTNGRTILVPEGGSWVLRKAEAKNV